MLLDRGFFCDGWLRQAFCLAPILAAKPKIASPIAVDAEAESVREAALAVKEDDEIFRGA